MKSSREFRISDECDGFDLSMLEGGFQVGGAWFDDTGDGSAFSRANELGNLWKNNRRGEGEPVV